MIKFGMPSVNLKPVIFKQLKTFAIQRKGLRTLQLLNKVKIHSCFRNTQFPTLGARQNV